MSVNFTLDSSFNIGSIKGITASENGAYIYSLIDNDGVYRSTDFGVNWTKTYSAVSAQLSSITCNLDGSIVYFCWVGGGLFKSTNYGITFNNLEFANLTAINGGPYIRAVACNTNGNTVIVSLQGGSSYVYISTNGTTSWNSVLIAGTSSYIYTLCCNSDATILFAIVGPNNAPSGVDSNIYTSTDSGTTWSILTSSFTANWSTITCDSTGTKIYATVNSVGLYFFSSPTSVPTLITSPNTSNFGVLSTYSSGAKLLTGRITTIYKYTLTYPYPMCFKKDSKILCLKEDKEIYVPIQDIRKGVLVKTILHGYVPVCMIGAREIYHACDKKRTKQQLYKCSTTKYPELFEDLILTGCHSILVEEMSEEEKIMSIQVNGDIYITDNKYRLPACIDERTSIYETPGNYNVYHLALDNDDYYMNHGIYANGLLVETSSKRSMKELSDMNLIE